MHKKFYKRSDLKKIRMVAVSGKNSWLVTRAFDGFVFLLYSGFVMWAYVLYFEAEQNWTEDAISKSCNDRLK